MCETIEDKRTREKTSKLISQVILKAELPRPPGFLMMNCLFYNHTVFSIYIFVTQVKRLYSTLSYKIMLSPPPYLHRGPSQQSQAVFYPSRFSFQFSLHPVWQAPSAHTLDRRKTPLSKELLLNLCGKARC